MVKKSKGKHRLDKYYHLAKEQGFRSRAAFKLVQLNRQFGFLDRCRSVLDLCAAPGGWLQVAQKALPVSSLIVGVDLDKIKPIPGCTTLVGDITTPATAAALKRASRGAPFDVVLHDGAPNVGGAWSAEAYGQSALVLDAAKLAAAMLAPGGAFVTKVFRSKDYTALLFAFKQLFDRVDATKPAASRSASAEIFVVCRGFKAPAKLDPRLLDARHLFKDSSGAGDGGDGAGTVVAGPDALLHASAKAKRARGGYDDGALTLRRTAPAAAFIGSAKPIEVLGRYNAFLIDGPGAAGAPSDAGQAGAAAAVDASAAAAVAAHPATTPAVCELVADLGVLGRSEFKALLKWRADVRASLDAAAKAAVRAAAEAAAGDGAAPAAPADDADANSSDSEVDALAAAKDRADAAAKRARRRAREAKAKARRRAAAAALGEGVVDEAAVEGEGLFSLAAVRGRGADARALAAADAPDSDAAADDVSDDSLSDDDAAAYDSESERYAAEREAALDDLYASYVERARGRRAAKEEAVARERAGLKRARLADGGGAGPEFGSGSEGEAADGEGGGDDGSPSDDDDDGGGAPVGGGLLVGRPGAAARAADTAAQWYGGGAAGLFAADDASDGEEGRAGTAAARGRKPATAATAAPRTPATAPAKPATDGARGYEVVPAPASDSDDDLDTTDDEAGGADPDAADDAGLEAMHPAERAVILATARAAMRGSRRSRILDAGYNRHAYNDPPGNLPRWFADDERRHVRPPTVVSRDEVAAEREAAAAADARPIKKVAQAKARKAKRLAVRLEAARKKAEAVAGDDELGAKGKAREVEKIMAKARAGRGAKRGKQSRSAKLTSEKKARPLDRRLRADRRGEKKMKGRKAPKGGGGGKKGGKAKGGRR